MPGYTVVTMIIDNTGYMGAVYEKRVSRFGYEKLGYPKSMHQGNIWK